PLVRITAKRTATRSLKRFITIPPFSEIKGFPDDLPQNNLPTAITPVRIAGSSKTPFKKVDS
ncbi:MAG: hypothetical protein PVH43_15160, partial [Desulfobacterales bacterium]